MGIFATAHTLDEGEPPRIVALYTATVDDHEPRDPEGASLTSVKYEGSEDSHWGGLEC